MEPNTAIGPKINALSHAMDQALNRSVSSMELTASQGFVLGYLTHHRSAPVFQRDLEREFGFSHPTASGILQRLESKGFVQFAVCDRDRRCKQILVTDKALQLHEQIRARMQENETQVTKGMSAAEIAQFQRLLNLAMKNMGAELGCCPER